MLRKQVVTMILAGIGAGAVNGLFGAGGGMILVPLLTTCSHMDEKNIYPASISIIHPITLITIIMTAMDGALPLYASLPYLIGSALGGVCAGIWGKNIPVQWLHRGLGIMILWGGIRYLC